MSSRLILPRILNRSRHDQRRQAERRLVQQHQAGPQHQRAGDREHLLFAAGQRAGLLGVTLLEHRKCAYMRSMSETMPVLSLARDRAELQVLLDRHGGEGAAALRHMGDAEPDDVLGRAGCRAACPRTRSRRSSASCCRSPAAWWSCRRRWRRAACVSAAFVEREVEAVQGLDLAVIGAQVLDVEHRGHWSLLPR